jgi:hypothetical protein
MIISHKYKFIFIKTIKTAGTSIEVFLSPLCGEDDILTPVNPHVEPHVARNYKGYWNPIPQVLAYRGWSRLAVLKRFVKRKKFFNHMPAKAVRATIPAGMWNNYFKFCVERNPWDKVMSGFHMEKDFPGGLKTMDAYLKKGRFPANYPIYTDNDGKLLVDEVVRYESLMEGLGRVFDRLGIPFSGTLGVKAKSEHRKTRAPYQQAYTEPQKDLVARVFAKEIEMHGYAFEDSPSAPRHGQVKAP